MKNIIVVTDKKDKVLRDLGRRLVHSISKSQIAQAALFSPKEYENNESQITGNQPVIFLGINEASESFFEMVRPTYNKFGIIWGYDRNKALIYTEEFVSKGVDWDYDKVKILKDELKKLEEQISVKRLEKIEAIKRKMGVGGAGFFGSMSVITAFVAPLMTVPLLTIGAVFGWWTSGSKEIKKAQYIIGIKSFMLEGFEEFIKNMEPNT